eukprot:6343729-Amphidinium_carterae.1
MFRADQLGPSTGMIYTPPQLSELCSSLGCCHPVHKDMVSAGSHCRVVTAPRCPAGRQSTWGKPRDGDHKT